MAKTDEETRIAVALPQSVRDELADVAFLLRVNEKDLVTKAIAAAIDSIKKTKGEKIEKALEVLKAARAED
jgi:hypothetical protein